MLVSRTYQPGNPTATAALQGSTLPQLVAACDTLLSGPMSDDVLRSLLDDMARFNTRRLAA